MDAKTNPPFASADISLVCGGAFYRAEQLVGLIHPYRWNLVRRIAALIHQLVALACDLQLTATHPDQRGGLGF